MSGSQSLNNKSVFAGQKSKVMGSSSYALSSSSSSKKSGNNTKMALPTGSCGGKSMTSFKRK